MARRKRYNILAAMRARAGRRASTRVQVLEAEAEPAEETSWNGDVNHYPSDAESVWSDDEEPSGDEDNWAAGEKGSRDTPAGVDVATEALAIDALLREQRSVAAISSLATLRMNATRAEWTKIEANRNLGYNKQSQRKGYYDAQKRHDAAAVAAKSRNTPAAKLFRSAFAKVAVDSTYQDTDSAVDQRSASSSVVPLVPTMDPVTEPAAGEENVSTIEFKSPEPSAMAGYLSDMSDDGSSDNDEDDVAAHPRPKRRKLEIPAREQAREQKNARQIELSQALAAIDTLLRRTTTDYQSPLQHKRAEVIQSTLRGVIKSGRSIIDASERAAEAYGLAEKWGGRMARSWVRNWVARRQLPDSNRGRHAKTWSLLNDPAVKEELRAYLRSNKWAMNPARLVQYTRSAVVTEGIKKYLRSAVEDEMPKGLKRYVDQEILPRHGYTPVRGISLSQAVEWLHSEGFAYTEVVKAPFFDGHERPDNVEYRQNVFIPAFEAYRPLLVEWSVGDLDKPVEKQPPPPGKHWLVLTAHDEMVAQAHDGKRKMWVLEGEMPIRKKGVGRGIHRSDIICSTVGHIVEASESLEYGKAHEGYWDGAKFVKQLETRIIPAFEKYHDRSKYRALFLIDNSQGHCAYAADALVATRMNLRSGGKQAMMRDGWFIRDGQRISQPMTLLDGSAKGMAIVLQERSLFRTGLHRKCDTGECDGSHSCCARAILEHQPDFIEQKSLVQETIERLGHKCIFLPKYHCELNFIEFFWGRVKKYLREHCDYTFSGLRERMAEALASVEVRTIRLWERRTYRWIEAYKKGLNCKDAQLEVRRFSSRRFKSHRRVGERMGRQIDAQNM